MSKHTMHLKNYQESVVLKYQIYNALFTTLPFEEMKSVNTDVLLFQDYCRRELLAGKSPDTIVNAFFKDVLRDERFEYKAKMLLLILQFLERQVVLLDALESAAFEQTHHLTGVGSLTHYLRNLLTPKELEVSYQFIKKYHTRIVLTAHPTQFYPFQVLEIIEDLTEAIQLNDLNKISSLLLQLGKTSFKNAKRPTPVDEAEVHIYYLEHIFYPVIKQLQCRLSEEFVNQRGVNEYIPIVLELGFWPGGDRDGNPNVTPETTIQVAQKLKASIIKIYLHEIDRLKRRLTFANMWPLLDSLKNRLLQTLDLSNPYADVTEFLAELIRLKEILVTQHNGLFAEKVDAVITAVRTFGFHFASIDIRQDSRVHTQVLHKILVQLSTENEFSAMLKDKCSDYEKLSANKKLVLLNELFNLPQLKLDETWLQQDSAVYDVIGSLRTIPVIQKANGVKALHRYIISNSQAVYNVIEVMLLAKLAGLSTKQLNFDIVPLFETITDLKNAPTIMQNLYRMPIYRDHLKQHGNLQIAMLGYSDGTKDGGYLTANWSILQCKKCLYELSKIENVNIQFFDGRGGTPARGGGNIFEFYRSMDQVIAQEQIQVTLQGQTISSDFGTREAASFNMQQLLTAGMLSPLLSLNEKPMTFSDNEIHLLNELSQSSYLAYQELKEHPIFVKYMRKNTPVKYYSELNNASRPPSRSAQTVFKIKSLRAIPFVGSWSQIKQNVPVFYGIGTAIKKLVDEGQGESLKILYRNSLFFRTLLLNSMQSILKSDFSLTQYLQQDPIYGEFWQILQNEFELTIKMLKLISEQTELLENDPVTQSSIAMREKIVIPLSIIQQYALIEIEKCDKHADHDEITVYKKLILKSLTASTNASKNST